MARQGGIARRRHTRDVPEPLTLDHRLDAHVAWEILAAEGQAMAYVTMARGRFGVVTAEDLCFAREWAGPAATVGHAVTQAVIDLEPGGANAIAVTELGDEPVVIDMSEFQELEGCVACLSVRFRNLGGSPR